MYIKKILKGGEHMKQVKFCMSMTEKLYKEVKELAEAKEMTVACFIRQAIKFYIERG